MLESVSEVVRSTLDYAPSLVFTAVGAAICERSGVVNLGLEGMMRVGAFAAATVSLATGSVWAGLAAGMLAGCALSLVHGLLCVQGRSDQVVTGVALNLVALAGVTFWVEASYGSSDTPVAPRLEPLLASMNSIPLVGAFFGHPLTTYLALAVPFVAQFAMSRTVLGLRLRAVGDKPQAVSTLGLPVNRLRLGAVLVSGTLAGLGGATLSLSVLDHFNDLMPYGQGFIALAAMVFGKWQPLGAAGAATFFALADALRLAVGGLNIPSGVMLALPYLLSLALLAGVVGRATPPAASGRPFDPEER